MAISQIGCTNNNLSDFLLNNYSNSNQTTKNNIASYDSYSVSSSISIFSEIAQKYDVTNMSPVEKAELSQELYDNGLISESTFARLSFDLELSPYYYEHLGCRLGKTASPETARNFLSEWRNTLEMQLNDGASDKIIANTEEIVNLLENLNVQRENSTA